MLHVSALADHVKQTHDNSHQNGSNKYKLISTCKICFFGIHRVGIITFWPMFYAEGLAGYTKLTQDKCHQTWNNK